MTTPIDDQQPNTTPTTPSPPTSETPTSVAGNTRELSRREFMSLLAGLGVTIVAAQGLWNWFVAVNDPLAEAQHHADGPHWAMVIDLERCIGCERCVHACQATNDTADGHIWNVMIPDKNTFTYPVFITRPCMHCEHAPCVEVCPVGATYHREDGLVAMDYDKCIGCRYCMVACPYGSRVFNWSDRTDDDNESTLQWGEPEVERRPRGVAEKCTFCSHRIDQAGERGLRPGYDRAVTPACCNACPTEARVFGDLKDANSPASQALQGREAVVLRSELGTNPRVFYLLPS